MEGEEYHDGTSSKWFSPEHLVHSRNDFFVTFRALVKVVLIVKFS